jgi:hypothetical protein
MQAVEFRNPDSLREQLNDGDWFAGEIFQSRGDDLRIGGELTVALSQSLGKVCDLWDYAWGLDCDYAGQRGDNASMGLGAPDAGSVTKSRAVCNVGSPISPPGFRFRGASERQPAIL